MNIKAAFGGKSLLYAQLTASYVTLCIAPIEVPPPGKRWCASTKRGAFPSPVRAVVWFSPPEGYTQLMTEMLSTHSAPSEAGGKVVPQAPKGPPQAAFIPAPQAPTTSLGPAGPSNLRPLRPPGLSTLAPAGCVNLRARRARLFHHERWYFSLFFSLQTYIGQPGQ